MQVLISTIIRNRINTLPLWSSQIAQLIKLNPDITFSLSVYTNDNTDGSDTFLANLKIEGLDKFIYKNETLQTPQYGSIKAEQRVKQLAFARNQTLDQIDLSQYDKVIFIEPDIQYNPAQIRKLIDTDYDCISGRSTCTGAYIYDSWGTRLNSEARESTNHEPIKGVTEVYATFNCLVVYKAKPLQEGARFSHYNKRLNCWDCDTILLAENIHKLGYHKHAIDCDVEIKHL